MQSFHTKMCVGKEHWLLSLLHQGYNCDNPTVALFDKLNCIIITVRRLVMFMLSTLWYTETMKTALQQSIEVCLY